MYIMKQHYNIDDKNECLYINLKILSLSKLDFNIKNLITRLVLKTIKLFIIQVKFEVKYCAFIIIHTYIRK